METDGVTGHDHATRHPLAFLERIERLGFVLGQPLGDAPAGIAEAPVTTCRCDSPIRLFLT